VTTVGRRPLDDEARVALEHTHPDLSFDWQVLGRDAALSQLGYLAIGAIGLPVFSGGGAGFGHFLGVTGGYLIAFPIAAALVGAALRPGDSAARATGVCVAATLLILALGAIGVAASLGVSAERAIALGVLPFLPGGAIKIAAAVALVVRAPLTR